MTFIKQILTFIISFSLFLLIIPVSALAGPNDFEPMSEEQKTGNNEELFIRNVVQPDSLLTTALQTSIIRMTGKGQYQGTTIDLVGAIHLADQNYYETLNRLFKEYDSVFYELVYTNNTQIPPQYNPPKQTVKTRKVRTASIPGIYVQFQLWAGDVLKLVNQVEFIDYTQPNMIHADINGEQLLQSMLKNGDISDFLFEAFRDGMTSGPIETQRFMGTGLLFARNRSLALKRMLANVMTESLESEIINAEKSTLIAERNNIALARVEKELSSTPKKYAIFYGAAHLSHLYKRLKNDFGFQPVGIKWLTAWDIPVTSKKQLQEKAAEK